MLALTEPRSLCHHESFWVAEIDGGPAAALCTFDTRAGGWATVASAMSNVERELVWTEAELAASRERVSPVWACFLPEIGADWSIENVGTLPEYRGRGLASVLIDRALKEGTERGCKLAQITTFIGNDTAQSVYKGAGFRFSDEKRCGEITSLLGAAGFVRFISEL